MANVSGQDGPTVIDESCCSVSHTLTDTEIAADVGVLSSLANDTRYETLRLIAESESDVCVCNLESALDVSQSAVSQALRHLFNAGLVTRRKDGRWRYYRETPQANRLLTALDETRDSTHE